MRVPIFNSIALTKKDEESTLLIFGTTKLNWHDLVLNSWCSSTNLKLFFKYAGHFVVLYVVVYFMRVS
jgi:hypothetical protein